MCAAPDLKEKPELWDLRKKRGKEGQYKWFRRKDMRKYICYSATYTGNRQLIPLLGLHCQYIGITCQGLNRRKSLHVNQAKRGDGSVFQFCLRELGYDNFEWKIEGEGEKVEMQRLESRLIDDRNTLFPNGMNTQPSHAEENFQWREQYAEMERQWKSDPLIQEVEDFLLKTEIAYASENPKLYENLDEWDIDRETNTLVRNKN